MDPKGDVFKTPEGPVPKRRKLAEVDSEAPLPPFSLVLSLSSSLSSSSASQNEPLFAPPSPLSPSSSLENLSRHEHVIQRTNSGANGDLLEHAGVILENTTTPTLTPVSSPRHSCPSSPCESHHSSHHVHHAKLQVLRPLTPTNNQNAAQNRRVGLVVFAKDQLPVIDALPKTPMKCATIQSLLESFGLTDKVETIVPAMASAKDLQAFHSEEFVEALRASCDAPSSETDSIELEEDLEIHGLREECTPFPQLWQYARLTAGATILAARYLIECTRPATQSASNTTSASNSVTALSPAESPRGEHHSIHCDSASSSATTPTYFEAPASPSGPIPAALHRNSSKDQKADFMRPASAPSSSAASTHSSNSPVHGASTGSSHAPSSTHLAPVAINWMGGRHHAKREEAGGLCFVNDAVLGLLQLVNHFERVLYMDIDIHHGDGTEEAFRYSKQVLTVSCHLHDAGFYPGSGDIDEIGEGKAKYFTINVPFKPGVTDQQYTKVFDSIINEAMSAFMPQAIVLVCGADCLSGDPLGGFNLTLHGVEHCVRTLLGLNLPLLILGGGGYHLPSSARLAAIVTALCLNTPLPDKISIPSTLFVEPSTYYVPESRRANQNTEEYLKMLEATVLSNLQHIRPSTGHKA